MPQPSLSEFQQQAIDALRQQQDAYLTLVREWKRAAGAKAFPQQPTPFTPTLDPSAFESLPSPAELVEATQAFTAQVMEQQQRFLTSLNDILGK